MPGTLFKHVSLLSTKLQAQKLFYARDLDFPLDYESEDAFTIRIGDDCLEFLQAELPEPPLYHFAIDVPENHLDYVLDWTRARIKVEDRGAQGPIHFFEGWNAHAFYWLDAEGNIGEFIARHTAGTTGDRPFNVAQIVGVTELGVVTTDVPGTCRVLTEKLELRCYPDPSAEPGTEFQAMGDERGLFIVAKAGRTWLGDTRPAKAFPAKVAIRNAPNFELTDTGCTIYPA